MVRGYFRYGLRTLLGAVTICAIAGGWWAERTHQRHAAIRTIHSAGGGVQSEYDERSLIRIYLCPTDTNAEQPTFSRAPFIRRTWREQLLGDRLRMVNFPEGQPLSSEALAAVATIHEVRHLQLDLTNLNDEGLAKLAGLRRLETLQLRGTRITDRSAAVLAGFQELKWLELDDTQLTDAAAPHLAKLQKLEVLRIQGTRLTDRGFAQLAALKNLRDLSIGDSPKNPMPVSLRCHDQVQQALPNCRLNGTFRGD
jgi:hypothetical protein